MQTQACFLNSTGDVFRKEDVRPSRFHFCCPLRSVAPCTPCLRRTLLRRTLLPTPLIRASAASAATQVTAAAAGLASRRHSPSRLWIQPATLPSREERRTACEDSKPNPELKPCGCRAHWRSPGRPLSRPSSPSARCWRTSIPSPPLWRSSRRADPPCQASPSLQSPPPFPCFPALFPALFPYSVSTSLAVSPSSSVFPLAT